MEKILGIRREDKNKWEARVPLIPEHVAQLVAHGYRVIVEPNPIRCIHDSEYARVGAELDDDLSHCDVIFCVKEIPKEKIIPDTVYVFFSHVIKGQEHNMPMLRRLLETNCTLLDYERIVDEQGQRLVFFGRFAGMAGMVDGLWALGQRLAHDGIENHFIPIRTALGYFEVEKAKTALRTLGDRYKRNFVAPELAPLIIGISGYGNVSRGAQEILDCLPVTEIAPAEVPEIATRGGDGTIYKVVFHEEHMFERTDGGPFELQHYYQHPEKYRSKFEQYLPHLTMLVNSIYWDSRYPRLVTRKFLRELYADEEPRLKVIADISCDLEGSVEATVEATTPEDPVYTYDVESGTAVYGRGGKGPAIMATDNLPCEFPVDSSRYFSETLLPFIPEIADADYTDGMEALKFSYPIKKALLALHGELTPDYEYINRYLHEEQEAVYE
jgi:alanine dehydrogenase